MFYGAEEFKVKTERGSVPCISFGSGEKAMVIIPGLRLTGLEGTARPLAWYYRAFAKEFRVYIIGRGEDIPAGVTVRDMAEDTAAAMKSLGLERACVLGASMGGMIAQELALAHPGLVSRLALAVTLSRPNDTVREVISRWLDLAKSSGLAAVAEDYMRSGYSEAFLRKYGAFVPRAVKAMKFIPKERFLRLAAACLTCDTYDRLEDIRCPALVIGGAEDRIVGSGASPEIAAKLGCACHIYEGLGHEAYSEAKDFNSRVLEFFRG
jgi:pimeloyl-ACP methyl ester carboxylesterase